MLFVRELHEVVGAREEAFEAAYRERYAPALARGGDARLLYYLHHAHGSGPSYHVVTITAVRDARMMLLGGAGIDGPRYIWWNFVSSSKERIEQAKADWKQGRFKPVPGETEFIPLPDF